VGASGLLGAAFWLVWYFLVLREFAFGLWREEEWTGGGLWKLGRVDVFYRVWFAIVYRRPAGSFYVVLDLVCCSMACIHR
jgi:hypothetical protein